MKTLTALSLYCFTFMYSLPTWGQLETVSSVREKSALRKAKELREKLVQGADFATLAKAHSDDPGSAPMGGELGFVDQEQFVPEYQAAVATLSPGELSLPVRSQFGYHLIELIERKEDQVRTRHLLIKP